MQIQATHGLTPAEGWPEFPEAFTYSEPLIAKNHELVPWYAYLFVLKEGDIIVGSGGYKGAPDGGMVEIGYEVAPGMRGQGIAREAAQGMIDNAFASPDVTMVDAHTLPEENPSVSVLKRMGMQFQGTVDDPDEGPVWHWRIART